MATILVVSQNVPSLQAVREALSTSGHQVLWVTADAELLEVSRQRRFDVTLIDLEHAELAALARDVSTKVVLFSGADAEVTQERVKRTGAHGYVRKLGPERVREDLLRYLSVPH